MLDTRAKPDPTSTGLSSVQIELVDRMVGGHRVARERFCAELGGLAERGLGPGIVWGVFRAARLVETFALDAEGGLVGVDGQRFELPASASIGVPHPLELGRAGRRVWLDRFAHVQGRQLALQLRRPRLRLAEHELSSHELLRFADRPAAKPVCIEDGGRWQLGPRGYELALRRGCQQLRAVVVHRDARLIRVFDQSQRRFGELDAVLVSEMLCALEQLTTLPYGQLELEVQQVEAGGPKGECVVCAHAFGQGERALALWRPCVDGSRRRAWTHWGCMEELPELQLGAEHEQVGAHLRGLLAGTQAQRSRAGNEAQILERCPDTKAVGASKQAARLRHWACRGHDRELAWGEYHGGGHYEVAADLGRRQVRCNCPSRKQPCKHGVALMLLFARGQLGSASPPGWARAHFPDTAAI